MGESQEQGGKEEDRERRNPNRSLSVIERWNAVPDECLRSPGESFDNSAARRSLSGIKVRRL